MGAPTPAKSIVFKEIASAIGRDAARKLIEELGGSRVYVPKAPDAKHDLTRAIGPAAAERLAYYFHGTRLILPAMSAAARRKLARDLDRAGGLTRAQIARQAGLSERQVYRILGDERTDQGDLFGHD